LIKRNLEILTNKSESERILKEILLFENFTKNKNILKLLNVIKPKQDIDVYYIFEFIEANLSNVISSKILTKIHIKYIIYQLLKAIRYIHSADVIHRDLSSNNILIDRDSLIKISDFSFAISLNDQSENNFSVSDFVQSRYNRAPELLLSANTYGQSVDIWSIGCILAEMVLGKLLFKGSSTINQLGLIMELIGIPTDEDIGNLIFLYFFIYFFYIFFLLYNIYFI
jgi:mitogen-activated protein kinase 15